jgi:hypothetical protein
MDRNLVLLNQNIARLRRDVRLQAWEIEQLIAADVYQSGRLSLVHSGGVSVCS